MTTIEKAKKKLLNWKKKWKNLGLKGMDSLNIKLNGSLDGAMWYCCLWEKGGENFASSTVSGHLKGKKHILNFNKKSQNRPDTESFRKRVKISASGGGQVDHDVVLSAKTNQIIDEMSSESIIYICKLMSLAFFIGINSLPFSLFPKLCDFIVSTKSGIFGLEKYQTEDFCKKLIVFLSRFLRNKQLERIRKSAFWDMLIDGTTDLKLKKRFIFLVTYYGEDKNGILEKRIEFLRLFELESSDALSIVKTLDDDVTQSSMDWKKCIGGSTDNEATMTGVENGVVTKLKEKSDISLFLGCLLHNDSLGWACLRELTLFRRYYRGYDRTRKFFKYQKKAIKLNENAEQFKTYLKEVNESSNLSSDQFLGLHRRMTTRWTSEGTMLYRFPFGQAIIVFDTVGILIAQCFGNSEEKRELKKIEKWLGSFPGLLTALWAVDIADIHLKLSKGLQKLHTDVMLFQSIIESSLVKLEDLKLEYEELDNSFTYDTTTLFAFLLRKHVVREGDNYFLQYKKNLNEKSVGLKHCSKEDVKKWVERINEVVDELSKELRNRYKYFIDNDFFPLFQLFLPKDLLANCPNDDSAWLDSKLEKACDYLDGSIITTTRTGESTVVNEENRKPLWVSLGMKKAEFKNEAKGVLEIVKARRTETFFTEKTVFEFLNYLKGTEMYESYVKLGFYLHLIEVKNDQAEVGFKKLKEIVTYKRLNLKHELIEAQMRLGLCKISLNSFHKDFLREVVIKYFNDHGVQANSLNEDVLRYRNGVMKELNTGATITIEESLIKPFCWEVIGITNRNKAFVKLWLQIKHFKVPK